MSLNSRRDGSNVGGQPPSAANLIPSASMGIGGSAYIGRQPMFPAAKSRKADLGEATPACC